jgi:ABC-type multidrug transport system fused ATPase/permease subunit
VRRTGPLLRAARRGSDHFAALRLLSPGDRRHMVVLVTSASGLVVLEMVALVLLYLLVQVASDDGDLDTPALVLALAVSVGALQIVKAGAGLLLRRRTAHALVRAESAVQEDLFSRFLRAPLSFHLDHNSSEFVRNLMHALPNAVSRGLGALTLVTAETVLLAGMFLTALVLQPVPALVSTAYFGVCGWLLHRYTRPRQVRAGQQYLSGMASSLKTANDAIGAIREILVADRQMAFVELLGQGRTEAAAGQEGLMYNTELPRYVLEICIVAGLAPLAAIQFVTGGRDSLAGLVLFAGLAFRSLPSLSRILAHFGVATFSHVSARQVEQARAELVRALDAAPAPETAAVCTFEHSLELEAVCFAYPGHPTRVPVLRGVSLRIAFGEYVGLVGESGSGKSTLLDLLVGLQQPTSGRITVDGVDLRAIPSAWRQLVGYVPQQPFILDTTVLGNVAFGEPVDEDVDRDRVWEALRTANLTDVVRALPRGLDTNLGERGMRLSGGQRQRLGIARAMYRRPRLLVLDEATAAVDIETEREILRAIEALAGQITIVAVTHRTHSLDRCDRVLRVDGGVVRPWTGMAAGEVADQLPVR